MSMVRQRTGLQMAGSAADNWLMLARNVFAAVAIGLAAVSCGGGSDTEIPATTVDAEPVTLYGKVVDKANNVADEVNQRTADLESQLQP